MNIAMGLQQAKELRDRIGVLEDRIKENLFCEVGCDPVYPDTEYNKLMDELYSHRLALVAVKIKIYKANRVAGADGKSVDDLRREQGMVIDQLAFNQALRAAEPDRYRVREGVRYGKRLSTMDLDKKKDALTVLRRDLDHQVRAKNALTKLDD